jgi:hypothetical protein
MECDLCCNIELFEVLDYDGGYFGNSVAEEEVTLYFAARDCTIDIIIITWK